MGSKTTSFTHLNCHYTVAAINQLARDTIAAGMDVVSLNEPYVGKGLYAGLPKGGRRWAQRKTAFISGFTVVSL